MKWNIRPSLWQCSVLIAIVAGCGKTAPPPATGPAEPKPLSHQKTHGIPVSPAPKAGPAPATDLQQVMKEIELAGAGVNLVEKPIISSSLRGRIQVPDKAEIQTDGGTTENFVVNGDNFAVVIHYGTTQFPEERQRLKKGGFYTADVDSDDLLLYHDPDGQYRFMMRLLVGYNDYVASQTTYHQEKLRKFSKEDCYLMIKCAKTLKPADAIPTDPRAVLECYGARFTVKNDKVKKIRISRGVTDTSLQLLAQFPDLEELDLIEVFFVTEKAFAPFAKLTELQRLNLERIRVKDAGLKYLKPCTKLRELRLINTDITDSGLATLRDFKDLKKLTLVQTYASPELTAKGVADLQKALPDLEISQKE